jgi:biotin carboxyl carrier protein
MYQLKINNRYYIETESIADGVLVNGNEHHPDIKMLAKGTYHVIENNQSYNVEVVSFDVREKAAEIKVNNNTYHVTAKDQFDLLLDQLGLSSLNSAKVSEVKAPMPGLVLKTFVAKGDVVQKGDNLLVLEAMKMENIIKAPADMGTVQQILVKPGDKVEKGQILILF